MFRGSAYTLRAPAPARAALTPGVLERIRFASIKVSRMLSSSATNVSLIGMPIPREARPLLPIRGESQAFQCEAAKNNAGVRRGRLRLPLVTLAPWGRKPPESGPLPISGATYDIVIENGTLTRGNHCAWLVEAVGIENNRFRTDSRNYS